MALFLQSTGAAKDGPCVQCCCPHGIVVFTEKIQGNLKCWSKEGISFEGLDELGPNCGATTTSKRCKVITGEREIVENSESRRPKVINEFEWGIPYVLSDFSQNQYWPTPIFRPMRPAARGSNRAVSSDCGLEYIKTYKSAKTIIAGEQELFRQAHKARSKRLLHIRDGGRRNGSLVEKEFWSCFRSTKLQPLCERFGLSVDVVCPSEIFVENVRLGVANFDRRPRQPSFATPQELARCIREWTVWNGEVNCCFPDHLESLRRFYKQLCRYLRNFVLCKPLANLPEPAVCCNIVEYPCNTTRAEARIRSRYKLNQYIII